MLKQFLQFFGQLCGSPLKKLSKNENENFFVKYSVLKTIQSNACYFFDDVTSFILD